jgi:hypothetical protein
VALRLVTDHEEAAYGATAAVPPHPVALTASEITGLIGLFQTMLDAMEGRIIDRLDINSRGATERWQKHDAELATNTARVVARFEKVETAIDLTTKALQAHLDREHDDDVRMDARIRPIRGSIGWVWSHWRDIVLLVIGLIALGTFLVESFGRVIGPHVP